MAKRRLYAIDPAGVRHSRQTARDYKYVVFILEDEEKVKDYHCEADRWLDIDHQNWDYYARRSQDSLQNKPDYEYQSILVAKDMINKHKTFEGYHQSKMDSRTARFERQQADGQFERWGVYRWTSRADLAHKASFEAAKGWCVKEVATVPVEGTEDELPPQ